MLSPSAMMAYSPIRPPSAGRPSRKKAPSASITVRLTEEEREPVDRHVLRTGWPRAELIREAMQRMGLFGMASIEIELAEPPPPDPTMPRSKSGPSQTVTIRLDEPERDAVWLHAQRSGYPRAVLIREAMHRMGLFSPQTLDIEPR